MFRRYRNQIETLAIQFTIFDQEVDRITGLHDCKILELLKLEILRAERKIRLLALDQFGLRTTGRIILDFRVERRQNPTI